EKAKSLIEFASSLNIDQVAIHKTSYFEKEDYDVYSVLKCIDLGIFDYPYNEKEANKYFLSQKEADILFNDFHKLLKNTYEINKKLAKKVKANVDQYKQRLFYELDMINKMGFADYFLIVYDFVKFAKTNDILVGPGRGSAPGSLVAYCLGITDIDPLEYDLLFERFLNPERITMPDIDVDFLDNKRDEVIGYVAKKYGKDQVAHITTFGTFGPRLAIRDVARVYKLSDIVLNEILRHVSSNEKSINDVIDKDEAFKKLLNSNSEVNKVIRIVQKLEGLPRHTSTHAAGIIMAGESLINYTPLQTGINDIFQTQFEASDLEKIGLVKMDLLGIRNLTIIADVIDKIK